MIAPQDSQTVDALRRRDEAAFRLIYTRYYPMVEWIVLRNQGTKDDAADVFQETMLVLIRNLDSDDWQLTASLKTYLYAVSHKRWMKRLHQKTRYERVQKETLNEWADEPAVCETDTVSTHPLSRWLQQITQHCQRLLQLLFFENRKIADAGYKNAHTAQNQQYKCLQQIRRVASRGAVMGSTD